MLRKLFWALLGFSLLAFVYFKYVLHRDISKDIFNLNRDTETVQNINIDNLSLGTSTNITLADKIWIQTFSKRLEKYNKKQIVSIVFDKYSDIYFKYDIGEIRANTKNNIDTSWNDMLSAMQDKDLKSKMDNKDDVLLYLDIRFPNKLFYKFKSNEKPNGEGVLASSSPKSQR